MYVTVSCVPKLSNYLYVPSWISRLIEHFNHLFLLYLSIVKIPLSIIFLLKVVMSMHNFKLYILGTIRTCGCRYIPPETKLLKFCRANIAKIMFWCQIKMLFLFLVSDLPFCLIRRIREPKNKVGTNYSNEYNILYVPIY